MTGISSLTICGLDELATGALTSATHVLSLLDPDWPEPHMLKGFGPRRRLEIRFHDDIEPGPGIVIPRLDQIASIMEFGKSISAEHEHQREWHLLVHCHLGISRSTAAMAILLAQFNPDDDEDAVFTRVVEIRPQAWPNSRMIKLADQVMKKNGRFKTALGRLYARQLSAHPDIAQYMAKNGRIRELEMGRLALRYRSSAL